jgi:G3E family GTPase
VITTVDAVHGLRDPESVQQAVAADRIVVTKTDLAEAGELERELRRLNPAAEILEVTFGEVEPERLFGGPEPDPRELSFEEGPHDHGAVHAFCLFLDEPLDWTAFGVWLTMLLQARGRDVLRVKGLLDVGAQGPVVLNGVQHVVHPPLHLDSWPDEDRRSRIVFVARGVDEEALKASLLAFSRAPRA